jgi:hypothetical protein
MASCPRCGKRAAKRFCPALNTKICPVCCARERMIELACPEGCQYLRSAREQAASRERELRAKELAAEGKPVPDVDERVMMALFIIDGAIIAAERESHGLMFGGPLDSEVLSAVENTIKNVETESSGIIYEHRAGLPRVQDVSEHIRAALDRAAEQAPADQRLRRDEILKALGIVRDTIKAHMRRGNQGPEASRNYIRHMALFYPWPEKQAKPLIV